ncbi:MAG TPA: hypothetical protein VGO60_12060 [Iamia sp.]|jgi:hypothetical protein|nr:hypothetical protein [Iamia sp.]
MRSRGAIALVVAALALTSCAGIGTVSQEEVTAEAQRRGGGITTHLVDAAVEAVAEETGRDPLPVHSITATLAQVTIVVPSADGSPGRDAWTYGTSGLYGGRGLTGPAVAGESAGGIFAVATGDLDVDTAGATARDAGGPGTWVESVTVARPGEGAEPVVSVVVTDGAVSQTIVVEGSR